MSYRNIRQRKPKSQCHCHANHSFNGLTARRAVLHYPGGKGTNCSKLSTDLGLRHLSSGELLRDAQVADATHVGDLIRSCMEEGKLVPSAIVVSWVHKHTTL